MSGDLKDVLRARAAATRAGEPVLLLTVVSAHGSTYRRPGARLLATRDGRRVGTISGGCLEADAIRQGWWRTRTGNSALLTYETRSDDDHSGGYGLGCGGTIGILAERIGPSDEESALDWIAACHARGESALVATAIGSTSDSIPIGARLLRDESGRQAGLLAEVGPRRLAFDAGEALERGRSQSIDYGEIEVFLEVVGPPVRLFVFGAGPDVGPVVALARGLNWDVTVFDRGRTARGPLPAPADWLGSGRNTAAVIMTHHYDDDLTILRALLPSAVGYLGLLGPRHRAERLLADLDDEGFRPSAEELARFHAPIGLDLGADGPEQVALAIIAEIQAVLNGRTGGALRDRHGSIHGIDAISDAKPRGERRTLEACGL